MNFRTLKVAICEGFYWGMNKISLKGVDVKKWGIKYKEGDWTSLPTMDPDINEYKTYIVTLLRVTMMTFRWCRPVIKTYFIYSARKSGNHSLSLQNKAFSVGQRKMYQ